jgi:drug/metabolite transporter (DMT)-like permease
LVWGIAAGLAGVGGLLCFYRALAVGTMGVVSPIAALGVVVPVLAGFAQGERPGWLQLAGMVLALGGAIAARGPELSGSTGGPPGSAASRRQASIVLAALTGLLFGLALFFMAQGSAAAPLLTVTSMRLVSLVIFTGAAVVARSLGGIRPGDLPLLVAIGVGDALANVLYGIASTMGLVSVVAVLGSLYPVVTVLLARLMLHERMHAVQAGGVGVAMTGVALIAAG